MRGAPTKAIQERAGHDDLNMTMKYTHLSPASVNAAIQLIEQRGAPVVSGSNRSGAELETERFALVKRCPHRDSNSGYCLEKAVS